MKYPKKLRLILFLTLLTPLLFFLIKQGEDQFEVQKEKPEDLVQTPNAIEELSPLEHIKKRLASAKSLEEFLKILKACLLEDELNTLQALAELDSIYLKESYPITKLLKEYFAERYTALDTIDRISALKNTKYNIYKTLAVDMLIWHAGKDDPKALVDYLNDPETYDISTFVSASVAYHAVRQDIAQAVELVDQVDDELMQSEFREAVFKHWASVSPEDTSEYLSSLEERGPEYDLAVNGLANTLDNRYHDVAMKWVDEIHDPVLQRDAYESVAAAWYLNPDHEDREEYAKWKSTVTDPDLLQQLNQHEQEHEERVYIKEQFQDSISSITDILRDNKENGAPTDGLDGELEKLLDLTTKVINLSEEHPDDMLLLEEAHILKMRIATDFPKLGELHPAFSEIISSYKQEQDDEHIQPDELIQRERVDKELTLKLDLSEVEFN